MLNIAYNGLCGGTRLEDIETRRSDAVFLDGLGTPSLPDPTTAGDFCRRFDAETIIALQEASNRARLKVWSQQPASFFAHTARIDADASIIGTDGECKQGIDIAYNACRTRSLPPAAAPATATSCLFCRPSSLSPRCWTAPTQAGCSSSS